MEWFSIHHGGTIFYIDKCQGKSLGFLCSCQVFDEETHGIKEPQKMTDFLKQFESYNVVCDVLLGDILSMLYCTPQSP